MIFLMAGTLAFACGGGRRPLRRILLRREQRLWHQRRNQQALLRGRGWVVVIVVDQMRADYIERFKGQWTEGGFKRLLEQGAWFKEAAYPYAATETCVGHATISTGSVPATHGMVANAWWDRDSQKMVTCTATRKQRTRAMQEQRPKTATPRGGYACLRLLTNCDSRREPQHA